MSFLRNGIYRKTLAPEPTEVLMAFCPRCGSIVGVETRRTRDQLVERCSNCPVYNWPGKTFAQKKPPRVRVLVFRRKKRAS